MQLPRLCASSNGLSKVADGESVTYPPMPTQQRPNASRQKDVGLTLDVRYLSMDTLLALLASSCTNNINDKMTE
jgi:hypothetical protein